MTIHSWKHGNNLYKGNLYWDKTASEPYEFDKINTDLNTSVPIFGG